MRSSYKKIGRYVQQANKRNKDMAVTNLRGININKLFMPSVANTVGVDLSKYKIVSKHQFAFNPMHVGRDEMLPISMLEADDPVIVSPAYVVFEIKDHEALDPEYLMMWCRRPEFDRNAWFTTDSSVRGGFSWSDFCDMELPVPSIEKQREIVREYNTIVNRIQLNEQLNQKLEETAQAIYKHWFVDFEFPISAEYAASIGKPELKGKPYKSSGGKMVFCEELKREVPKEWRYVRLDEMADLNAGGDKPKVFSENKTQECSIPIFANGTIGEGLFGFTNTAKVNDPCVTISARGGIGYTVLRHEPFVPIVRLIVAKPKEDTFLNYLFQTIKSFQYQDGTSSAQSQLTVPDISAYKLLNPKSDILTAYQMITKQIFQAAKMQQLSCKLVGSLSETLNAKMARAA
jgi:type I restriction enzyme, S subunit